MEHDSKLTNEHDAQVYKCTEAKSKQPADHGKQMRMIGTATIS